MPLRKKRPRNRIIARVREGGQKETNLAGRTPEKEKKKGF